VPQLQLVQGAYEARSVIANAQRCINLYPELNTKDAEVPYTHYCTPGLVPLAQGIIAEVRQLYTASNGLLFAVIGNLVYYIPDNFNLQVLGAINTQSGLVSMYDDTYDLIILDGSPTGWMVNLTTLVFSNFAPTNFNGGNQVRYLDTFLVSSTQGGDMQSSDSIVTPSLPTYNALGIATISGDADQLQIIEVVHKEIWAYGRRTTEIWSNVGAFPFPFQPIPGVFIQHGIAALRSLAKWGLNIFFLSQDNNGEALVMMGTAYKADIISTPAIADAIGSYETISDAIGFCYQQGTHIFYLLTFPTADKTWVYDLSTQLWHERAYLDENGALRRHRANCVAVAYGRTICGDWQNGTIYSWDLQSYTDAGQPIVRLRSFPHLVSNLDRISYKQFMADIEVGTDIDPASDPTVTLRWSDDRGVSFGNGIQQTLGKSGQYKTIPSWNRLGFARDRVFELSWTAAAATALNGAFIDFEKMET
jgi:hypothetical protein